MQRRGITERQDDMARRYTIFDSDPSSGGVTAWPDHTHRALDADLDLRSCLEVVRRRMESEAQALRRADGYEAGQWIYALVWDLDGSTYQLSYMLTDDDLARDSEDASCGG